MGVGTSRDVLLLSLLPAIFHPSQQHFSGRSVHGAQHEDTIGSIRNLAEFLEDPSSILESG